MVDYVTPSKYKRGLSSGLSSSHPNPECDCPICVSRYAQLISYPVNAVELSNICHLDPYSNNIESSKEPDDDSGIGAEDPLIFCSPRVWAFSFKDKSWRLIEVSALSEVTPDEKAFDKLVMEKQHKSIVEAMVDTYLSKDASISDFIKGKGRGVIVLLHGSPGTGKTLTAGMHISYTDQKLLYLPFIPECVAETKNRPLYMVTCGDLGINPETLEARLGDIFLLAINWKAILLLDEADVFLQERDLHDLNRNALVSVFLRHLEYYDGLLFLTTNRPGQLDEAFQSRIHITLGLPPLDWDMQKKVWRLFMDTLDINHQDKTALMKFIKKELKASKLNGRQIRNCLRAALAIATKEDRLLSKEHIQRVIDLGKEFTAYMEKLYRMDVEERARALGTRLSGAKSQD
jgi:AAA+ superfamily predicted ATPase